MSYQLYTVIRIDDDGNEQIFGSTLEQHDGAKVYKISAGWLTCIACRYVGYMTKHSSVEGLTMYYLCCVDYEKARQSIYAALQRVDALATFKSATPVDRYIADLVNTYIKENIEGIMIDATEVTA